jgi:uroporphyrin-III C-methyltransferase
MHVALSDESHNDKDYMKKAIKRTIYFIGAGPGDPDLLTVKAAKILARAQAVVVDRLVSPEILRQYVNAEAKIFFVGKQGHCSTSTTQSEINDLLVALAKEYPCVARLKGGDTAIFSNMMDELVAVNQHNISYEIVPGITAASGASAYTGVPLTARGYATGVKFLSGCSHAKISDEEWKCLTEVNHTMVWYMTSREWPKVARKLIFAGADLKLPLLVVEQATTPNQHVHQFLLEDFLSEHSEIAFMSPSIIIVGKVAALYELFSWYDGKNDKSAYFQPLHEILPGITFDKAI